MFGVCACVCVCSLEVEQAERKNIAKNETNTAAR